MTQEFIYQDTDSSFPAREIYVAVVDNNHGKIAVEIFSSYETAEKWCKTLTSRGSVMTNYYIELKRILG